MEGREKEEEEREAPKVGRCVHASPRTAVALWLVTWWGVLAPADRNHFIATFNLTPEAGLDDLLRQVATCHLPCILVAEGVLLAIQNRKK